jgi:hypothetical protein
MKQKTNEIGVYVGGELIDRLTPAEIVTSVTHKDYPSMNEYEFYLRKGTKHYFRNHYGKIMIDTSELLIDDLKKGMKVLINHDH